MKCRMVEIVGLSVGMVVWGAAAVGAVDTSNTNQPAPAATKSILGGTMSASGTVTPPSAVQIRDAVQRYVQDTTQEEGVFYIDDEVTGETRELTLDGIHDTVNKVGDYYSVCADMKDSKTGDLLDVDFDVDVFDGQLEVTDVSIHKVHGKARYTYDTNNVRVPMTAPAPETP